jgi:hypothetical protein
VKHWTATASARDAPATENRSTAEKIRKDAIFTRATVLVMPALVAGIHVFMVRAKPKTWMAGTSPAMTVGGAMMGL